MRSEAEIAEARARLVRLGRPDLVREFDEALDTSLRLERAGWELWYQAIFGHSFTSNLAPHHKDALDWHWTSRMAQRGWLRQGKFWQPGGTPRAPEHDAYPAIWAREHRKSNLARAIAVCDGCLATSDSTGGYCLYVSGTKAKVKGHSLSVESLLNLSSIRKYYRHLGTVKRRDKAHGGFSLGWTAAFIYTAGGYVYHFIGLDEGVAGANVDEVRPSLIVPDDIDDREASPVISASRFHVLTHAVLPTKQANTLFFIAQNLISRYSVTYQVYKQQARILTNRVVTEPVPAVYDMVTETRTVKGIVKDIIVSGRPSWPYWGLDRAQSTIDTVGLEAFLAEYQHEVEQSREGIVLQHWNDSVHVITWSEFERVFGCREIPRHWNKYGFHDWARTKTKYHANVTMSIAVSAQNSKLPGCYFVFNPRSYKPGSSPEDVAIKVLADIAPKLKLDNGQWSTWEDLIQGVLQKTELNSHRLSLTQLIEARRNTLAEIIPNYVEPIVRAQNYVGFRGSHEQSKTGALEIYRKVFGLAYSGVNPGADGGVNEINMAQRVDYKVAHPIKPDMMGYTRFFVIVADEEAEYQDALDPAELVDARLFRYQMRQWRWRDPYLTAQGENEGEPLKMNDDFGNCLMQGFYDGFMQAVPLSEEEQVEAAITPGYTHDELAARADMTMEQKGLSEWYAKALAQKAVKGNRRKEYDEYGQEIRPRQQLEEYFPW